MSIVRTGSEVVRDDVGVIAQRASAELKALAGRHVLLTGGAGFLGHMFVHVLAQAGEVGGWAPTRLTVYENFSRGRKDWLDELARRPNVEVVEHDITRPMPSARADFDFIIHAASIASPIYYRLHPIETIDANVNGLRHLLDYARMRNEEHRPLEGLLFFSTSEIYGDPSPDAIPTPETYRGFVSCTGPRACYDESKRLGETLCANFARQYGIRVSVARPFNNYGPGLGLHDRRVLPDLVRDMLNGADLTLLSDGRATRTFCYISDAIDGYLRILVRGRAGEPYNIGTEAPEVSMRDLAERVAVIGRDELDYRGRVVFKTSDDPAYLTDNPTRRCPDIRKARQELGYAPQVDLDEGLRRSIVWYRDNQQ